MASHADTRLALVRAFRGQQPAAYWRGVDEQALADTVVEQADYIFMQLPRRLRRLPREDQDQLIGTIRKAVRDGFCAGVNHGNEWSE